VLQVCNLIKHYNMATMLFNLPVVKVEAHYFRNPAVTWLAYQLSALNRTMNCRHNGAMTRVLLYGTQTRYRQIQSALLFENMTYTMVSKGTASLLPLLLCTWEVSESNLGCIWRYLTTVYLLQWPGFEYLHRSPESRRRRRKGNHVPGVITGPPCFWEI
jgi:hypothetical protein